MALTMRAKTFLKNLANRGDMTVQGTMEAGGPGAETTVTFTNAEAPVANWIATSTADNATTFALAHTTPGATGYPRNLTCTFGASWAGGDITINGTDQFGNAISEVIPDTAGQLVAGAKIFKTVTSWSKESPGAGGGGHDVTIGFGVKIGLPVKLANSFVSIVARANTGDYTTNQTATIDQTYSAFTPSSAADGSYDYQLIIRS